MKRLIALVGTTLSSLALAVAIATPASAASGSAYIGDAIGDQSGGAGWAAASNNARQAADIQGVTAQNYNDYLTISWKMSSVLPSTNTSYMQHVSFTGFLSGQPLSFGVSYNGTSAYATYAGVSPQCTNGEIAFSSNATNNYITLVTPLYCLPNGVNLSDLRAHATVYRGSTLVGEDFVFSGESLPWK